MALRGPTLRNMHSTLQTKDAQILKSTETMISMLSRVDNLQTQISGLEMQAPPHSERMSSISFVGQIPQFQFSNTVNIDDGPEIQPTDIPESFAAEINATYSSILFDLSRPFVQSGSTTHLV